MSAQPAIAELDFDVVLENGEVVRKGTVLGSGNSWGRNWSGNESETGGSRTNGSTNIDLYASGDKGRTWRFLSNVARGSGPDTRNGNPCIWEPYIL